MSDEILNYIIFLENTIAGFYENIKNFPEMERFVPVLDFMETHSKEHADKIQSVKDKYERPSMSDEIIIDMHNSITRDVYKKISNETNYIKVLELLAESEESVGILYKKISDFLVQLSLHYKRLSGEILMISKEEYDHRDILLRDGKKLAEKKKKNNPD